jgi:hypothetical protein
MQNTDWITATARAEAAAQSKQAAEEQAYERFVRARTAREQSGRADTATETPEFHQWMQARHESDSAWGQWALAMDAKPA